MNNEITLQPEFLFIKSEYKMVRINFDDILFCKGMKDYIQVYIHGRGKPLVTLQSLNIFMTKLPRQTFIRTHRSFIVSLNHIDTISRNEISIGKEIIPIGGLFKNDFFNMVELNS